MTTSDALVAFLNARLDEDAAIARAAGSCDYYDDIDGSVPMADERKHALHYAPARMLDEVEAMRAIVRRCEEQAAKEHDNAMEEDRTWTLWPVLFELAAIYRDHADYRQEWKP